MSILTRYITAALLRGWFITFLVVAAVFGLLAFIDELDAAHGDYGAVAVARFTLMVLPQQLLSLAPVILLLGTIIALAGLQKGSELTVISCAGVPISRLLLAIAVPTGVVTLLLWVGMETVTAPLHQRAEALRLALRYNNPHTLPAGGVWSKSGRRYIHLGTMRDERVPANIALYEFDAEGRLERAIHAATATVGDDRQWRFESVQEKRLEGGQLVTRRLDSLAIDNLWARRELPVLSLSPESMRLSVLYGYGTYLAANARDARSYLNTFWQRLALPLTAAAMVLLATPISAQLGSRRGSAVGVNLAIGALIGISFYLGSQIIFALGTLLGLPPLLVALLPALATAACAALLLKRMHW
ncbi:LPS export ABC transporter permease LptG [Pseudohaliea rubra]|uniref:Putative Permease n=1 Tax=Pseudohaliea rubra DSM 19751 TaxID=1265313 RepID=A0A095VSB4_9GAMM|nr:LPS export ABC transporter permease LptG [Pseudohaliea rubra]KGE03978.1 putative Permease [Pseudohaliea rubra DSM 19751]